jgi:predicted nucleic acid-binding protein
MSAKFFLDTNIFLYSFSYSEPAKKSKATSLVDRALDSGKGMISYQVVQEFFNVSLLRFVPRMSLSEAAQYLAMTFRPLLAVYPSYALYGQALQLTHRYSLSWYDSLIVAAALEGDCGVLYTEDLQHGQKLDNLLVQNPFL